MQAQVSSPVLISGQLIVSLGGYFSLAFHVGRNLFSALMLSLEN